MTPSLPHTRLSAVMAGLALIFCLLLGRLWQVTILHSFKDDVELVRRTLSEFRAPFVDRRGVLLATNVTTFSVYANPALVPDKREAARKLAVLFPDASFDTWYKRLTSHKRFIWIARHITPSDKDAVLRLGIPGVGLMKGQRRIWPHGSLCSHVLGFTNVDQIGISGLEKGLNHKLKNRKEPVKLGLDVRVQHIVREELRRTMETFETTAGNALVLKVSTGEVIASVSLPDFNPHMPGKASAQERFNRNTTGVYEFGSLMKIHNTALLLDSGLANLNSIFDASKPLCVGRFRITDFRGQLRPLTLREAFLFSSNIAYGKMALLAGVDRQKHFFQKMGFSNPVSLETPEKALPLMPSLWRECNLITASYGYGFAITPLHVVQSISTLVTGEQRPLTWLYRPAPVQGKPLLKQETARKLCLLLNEATLNGQAKKAAVSGYKVGAKTGTANLRNAQGRYVQGQNLTSCVAVFPIDSPEYVVFVSLERPKPNRLTYGYATAGWIAAPLISKIIGRAAPLLGVFPEQRAPTEDGFLSPPAPPQPPLVLTIDRLLKDSSEAVSG